MNFDLDQLRMFDAVMRLRNFRSAARAIGVPQSTLSQRIISLEAQVGHRLFARTTRRVEPTAHGRALHPHAGRLLGCAADIGRILDGLADARASDAPSREGLPSAGGHGAAARPVDAASTGRDGSLEHPDGERGGLPAVHEGTSRPLRTGAAVRTRHGLGGGMRHVAIPADTTRPHRGRARRIRPAETR